jgi:hypothetical protein
MEKEIRRNKDKFGNYESNIYPCPRCGAEFLCYVMQFDSHMCLNDDCGWFESFGFGTNQHPEKIDYENPKRSRD